MARRLSRSTDWGDRDDELLLHALLDQRGQIPLPGTLEAAVGALPDVWPHWTLLIPAMMSLADGVERALTLPARELATRPAVPDGITWEEEERLATVELREACEDDDDDPIPF